MKHRNMMAGIIGLLLVVSFFYVITPTRAAAPTFSITRPGTGTYYSQSLDIRAVNTTNNVNQSWFRYNNGSWSGNVSLTYTTSLGWWNYTTAATYWDDGDTYQLQVFMNATGTGEEGLDSETFTIDTTPTFTFTHPSARLHTEVRVPVEYTTTGAVSYTWNVHDGTTWVYASNQTSEVATGLSWSTSYTLYAYAIDGFDYSVVSTRAFEIGPVQGGSGVLPITQTDQILPNTVDLPIQPFGKDGLILLVIGGIGVYLYSRKKRKK